MTAIPASAGWTGEGGRTYVWHVNRSDEFLESTFVVNAVPVAVDHEGDGMVYFGCGFGGLSQSDAAAVAWPGTLKKEEPEELYRIRSIGKRIHGLSIYVRLPSSRSTAATKRLTAGDGSFAIIRP